VIAKSGMRVSAEADSLRPVPKRFKMGPKLATERREPVAGTTCMLDQARNPKLSKSLRKHARGHPWHPRRKLAEGHRVGAKLPYDPQRPASAQHVEQRKQAGICARRAPYLRQCSALTGSVRAPTSTVTAGILSQLVKCLDFRGTVGQASNASDSETQGQAGAAHSARHYKGGTIR
jgi:hypothetical protein